MRIKYFPIKNLLFKQFMEIDTLNVILIIYNLNKFNLLYQP